MKTMVLQFMLEGPRQCTILCLNVHTTSDPVGTEEGKSFVNNMNSVGHRTDPCGIHMDTGNSSDLTPFSTVHCLSLR